MRFPTTPSFSFVIIEERSTISIGPWGAFGPELVSKAELNIARGGCISPFIRSHLQATQLIAL
jgi:hypothetical protein